MKFYKYCASGNDFVLFYSDKKGDFKELAIKLCNRYSGIGADGLIVILPHEKYDFEWQFYNCDASEPAMCGNGSRAAAHFACHILKMKPNLSFLTKAGVIKANVEEDIVETQLTKVKDEVQSFEFEGKKWQICDTGVPHLVHFCEDLSEFDLKTCQILRQKYNANVNYAKIEHEKLLRVRTFERGVENETLACGTGMAACFYLGVLQSKLEKNIKVLPKSEEELSLRLDEEGNIFFQGKVRYCFEAKYNFS
ncbi:diaminopimelate epimerase [Campylobacter sp. MIT 12-8780]|uniref:diaminopimelate epimerase n=1 Tax=unclassified Campylobacter TaxID=2593542 RepID=UPI00115F030E|nr:MULTISPECIES: diaminopimelate epimerase [unclassified Campylobacter]NDJ27734.1 diaminopimelate epimerase [Campylobacter sp. MIT 19-121]TQR41058.1 diaminopimelate epimerase [Campylobacter sp. MIT 12-8780]